MRIKWFVKRFINNILGIAGFEIIKKKESVSMTGCFEYMTSRDYLIDDIAGYIYRPSDGALGQLDIAFVKSESHLRKSNMW